MKKVICAVCCIAVVAVLYVPGMAADKLKMTGNAEKKPSISVRSGIGANYKISFKVRVGGIERAASVLALNGVQTNYTAKSPVSVDGVKTKTNVVANFLPVFADNEMDVQVQFEVSTDDGTLADNIVVQYQGEFRAEKGKTVVLLDEPDKHVEVMVEDLK